MPGTSRSGAQDGEGRRNKNKILSLTLNQLDNVIYFNTLLNLIDHFSWPSFNIRVQFDSFDPRPDTESRFVSSLLSVGFFHICQFGRNFTRTTTTAFVTKRKMKCTSSIGSNWICRIVLYCGAEFSGYPSHLCTATNLLRMFVLVPVWQLGLIPGLLTFFFSLH